MLEEPFQTMFSVSSVLYTNFGQISRISCMGRCLKVSAQSQLFCKWLLAGALSVAASMPVTKSTARCTITLVNIRAGCLELWSWIEPPLLLTTTSMFILWNFVPINSHIKRFNKYNGTYKLINIPVLHFLRGEEGGRRRHFLARSGGTGGQSTKQAHCINFSLKIKCSPSWDTYRVKNAVNLFTFTIKINDKERP